MRTGVWGIAAAVVCLAIVGSVQGDKPSKSAIEPAVVREAVVEAADNNAVVNVNFADSWGTIKGKLVWGKPDLPEMKPLDIQKDKEVCLSGGPLKEETYTIDPATKGMANVFVFLKSATPIPIHPDYPQTTADVEKAYAAEFEALNKFPLADLQKAIGDKKVQVKDIKAPALIDQQKCKYIPHAIALREGQKVIVLNPEPIAHNVKVTSFKPQNNFNPNMPPGTAEAFSLVADAQPLNVQCSIHGWMQMYAMVFNHPYYVVTGKDGSFELKNVPAGEQVLVIRTPKFVDAKTGGKGTAKGTPVTVKAGETLDLGDIQVNIE